MLLAVDIGNSTISTGLFGLDGELRFLASLDTDYRKTADQICVDLMNLFQLYHFRYEDVTDSILCSVVPPLNFMMEKALTRLLGKPPVVVGPGVPAPASRASRWYSPSAVSSTDRNTSVTEVAEAASCCVSPSACQPLAISCPTAQIPPPTTKASAVSLPMGELGDSCRTSASYSLGVTPSHPFAGNMCRFRRGYTCQNP